MLTIWILLGLEAHRSFRIPMPCKGELMECFLYSEPFSNHRYDLAPPPRLILVLGGLDYGGLRVGPWFTLFFDMNDVCIHPCKWILSHLHLSLSVERRSSIFPEAWELFKDLEASMKMENCIPILMIVLFC